MELALPHLIKAGRISENPTAEEMDFARKLILLYQEQMSYGAEIVELSELFFKEDIEYGESESEALKGEGVPEVLQAFLQEVEALENFEAPEIKAAIKRVQKATGQKGKIIYANPSCCNRPGTWSGYCNDYIFIRQRESH